MTISIDDFKASQDAIAATTASAGTDGTTVTDSKTTVLGAVGANNNNNAYDSSSVVTNDDGSVLERLEGLKDKVSGVDSATNVIGADNNNNTFASTNVAANEDGTVLERLEFLQSVNGKGSGTAIAANKSLIDALGTNGSAVTDSAVSVLGAIGANNSNNAFSSASVVSDADGSVLERLEKLEANYLASGEKSVQTTTAALPQGTTLTLFTIAGGPIQIIEIFGVVTTNLPATANATKLTCVNSVTTTATDLCSTLDITGKAAGTLFYITGTLANALNAAGAGVVAGLTTIGPRMPAGTIRVDCAGSMASGSVQWFLRYRPIGTGVTVTAAF